METSNNNAANQVRYANDPPTDHPASRSRLPLSTPNTSLDRSGRGREVLRLAQEAFAKTGSWVVFYREMLGVDGVVRRLFPTVDEMRSFESTPEFGELQEMVAALRSQDSSKGDAAEPERMITIRLPKSLHDSLRIESEQLNLSINKLCISKLLQPADSRFVPIQKGRRRGRRPGRSGP